MILYHGFIDRLHNTAVFYDCTPKKNNDNIKYAYGIYFMDDCLELRLATPSNQFSDDKKTLHWMTDVFFPKFFNWAINDKGSKPTISSLSHVCVQMYCNLYGRLKEKYAKSLMNVSSTDFVCVFHLKYKNLITFCMFRFGQK